MIKKIQQYFFVVALFIYFDEVFGRASIFRYTQRQTCSTYLHIMDEKKKENNAY